MFKNEENTLLNIIDIIEQKNPYLIKYGFFYFNSITLFFILLYKNR